MKGCSSKSRVRDRAHRLNVFLVSTVLLAIVFGAFLISFLTAEPSVVPPYSSMRIAQASNIVRATPTEIALQRAEGIPLDPPEAQHPCEIQGMIYRSDGEFAVGAQIQVLHASGGQGVESEFEALIGQADGKGQFKFSGLPFGNYLVQASSGEEVAEGSCLLMHANPVSDMILQLSVSNGITGLVVDSDRNPIEGARVCPWIRDGEIYYNGSKRIGGVKSDAQGRFELVYLPPGSWNICVEVDGFGAVLTEAVPAGTRDLEIQLAPALRIAGRIVKGEEPVEGAQVLLIPDDSPIPEHRVASGADGSFSFNSVGPGDYLLAAEKGGDITRNAPQRVGLVASPVEGLEIELMAGGVVRGRVFVQETGEGIANVEVSAYVDGESWKSRRSEPSDKDGSFEIAGLSTGTYTLRTGWVAGFARYGTTGTPQKLEVEAGALREGVNIPLRRGITVSGRVLDIEGQPVAGAEVRGTREGWEDQQTSGADGSYVLANITLGGPILIQAEHSSAVSETYGPYDLPAEGLTGMDLQLTVTRTGMISGVVVDLRGRPVLGHVAATTNEKGFFSVGSFTTTDVQGRFMMPNVPPGAYDLSARIGNGRAQNVLSLSLEAGQEIRDLRLVLEIDEILEIAGIVRDEAGSPVRGASIQLGLETESQRFMGLIGGRSGFKGEFRIRNVMPGNYRLEAAAYGHLNATVNAVSAGDSNVLVTMQRSPRLSGVVVDTEGNPISAFDVAYVYRGDEVGSSNSLHAQWESFANARGAFEIIVPTGAFDVVARAKGYSTGRTQTSALDANESRDGLVVVLQKAEKIGGRVVDEEGSSVPGALIFSGPLPDRAIESAAYAVAVSDWDGRFEIARGEPGRALHLSAIHATKGMGEFYTEEATELVEIPIRAGASIVVETTQNGAVAPGALVTITGSDLNEAMADEQGRVLRRNLLAGEVAVSASSADRRAVSGEQIAVLESGMETRVELELVILDEEADEPAAGFFEKRSARE